MKVPKNYGKIILVIFITILIWVWADKAQDIEETFSGIIIKVAKSSPADNDLWLNFDGKKIVTIKSITLKGSSHRLEKMDRDRKTGKKSMEFLIEIDDLENNKPGVKDIDVKRFLEKSSDLKGVDVVGCQPETVNITVSKLVERELKIRVTGPKKEILTAKKIEPDTVKAMVPESWSPEQLFADVRLATDSEITQARSTALEKVAKVQFPSDNPRVLPDKIKVLMPPVTEDRKSYSITATIGFVYSRNMDEKYETKLSNESDIQRVSFKATPAAKAAFEAQDFHVLIPILDEDAADITKSQKRKVIYNFPIEFVEKGEIKLDQLHGEAEFKLKAIQ